MTFHRGAYNHACVGLQQREGWQRVRGLWTAESKALYAMPCIQQRRGYALQSLSEVSRCEWGGSAIRSSCLAWRILQSICYFLRPRSFLKRTHTPSFWCALLILKMLASCCDVRGLFCT